MVCIKGIMHIMGDKDTRSQPRGRRVHSAAFKRELVLRSLQPRASVSAIALEAGALHCIEQCQHISEP